MMMYRQYRVHIFWAVLAIVYALAIMPSQEAPSIGAGDKLDHVAAFFTLTLLGRAAYHQRSPFIVAAGLCIFGALIEVTQSIPFLQRDGNIADWVADSIAITVALPVSVLLARRLPGIFVA